MRIQFRVHTQNNDAASTTYSYVNVEAKDINDGFVLAVARAAANTARLGSGHELVSIEFWQVLPDVQPPAVVVGNDVPRCEACERDASETPLHEEDDGNFYCDEHHGMGGDLVDIDTSECKQCEQWFYGNGLQCDVHGEEAMQRAARNA